MLKIVYKSVLISITTKTKTDFNTQKMIVVSLNLVYKVEY